MMQQHLLVWLWREPWYERQHYQLLMGFNALGGMAAPLFVVLAGAGAALYLHSHERGSSVLFVRGLVLLVLGYALNVAVPSWFTPASWYVLHLIGSGLVCAVVLGRFLGRWLLLVAVAIVAVTPLLHYLLQTPEVLTNARMGQASHAGGVGRLVLVEGHFPLFPWLAMFLMGQYVGGLLSENRQAVVLRLGLLAIVIGAVAAGVGAVVSSHPGMLLHGYVRLRPRIYPLYFPLLAVLSGLAMVLVSVAVYYGRRIGVANPLVSLGRCSLSVFVVHVIVVRQGGHWWGFFKQFSTPLAILLSLSCIVMAFVLAHLWRGVDFRFGIEWFLRRIEFRSSIKASVPAGQHVEQV
jgi:uncharacterized membrane protein